jgi:hypothetical protein
VPEDQWFPRGREECDPRFWTIPQESFYASYTHRGSQLSQHRMLQFTALRAATAGEAILPFFDYQRGLVDLVTRRWEFSMPLCTSMLSGSLSDSCLWVSSSGLLERGSQSCFRWIYTMILFTTWRTRRRASSSCTLTCSTHRRGDQFPVPAALPSRHTQDTRSSDSRGLRGSLRPQTVCTLPDGECRIFDRGAAVAPDVCDGEAPL